MRERIGRKALLGLQEKQEDAVPRQVTGAELKKMTRRTALRTGLTVLGLAAAAEAGIRVWEGNSLSAPTSSSTPDATPSVPPKQIDPNPSASPARPEPTTSGGRRD